MKEELVSQEELVSKLQKEKKAWADGRQQKEEELQSAEDKANHLTKIKMKLEQNLDELEDSVEREKKVYYYICMCCIIFGKFCLAKICLVRNLFYF